MEISYSIKIRVKGNTKKISDILEIPSKEAEEVFVYEVIKKETDDYFDFINEFLNLLEIKYEKLLDIGIKKSDIQFWLLYEYDQQCNLEFNSIDLKRLGDNEITLNISCWQGG